jgi:hypothetical protein
VNNTELRESLLCAIDGEPKSSAELALKIFGFDSPQNSRAVSNSLTAHDWWQKQGITRVMKYVKTRVGVRGRYFYSQGGVVNASSRNNRFYRDHSRKSSGRQPYNSNVLQREEQRQANKNRGPAAHTN